jgi:hypothetical protein
MRMRPDIEHERPAPRAGLRPAVFATFFALSALRVAAAADIAGTPFAPHSQAASKTMFTPMPAAQTGIVAMNDYADPAMWAEHYQELAYGAMGTGVAAGDYDGDGRPDVFLVSKTGPSRLFRNLGDWKFEDVTERAGLTAETGLTGMIKGWFGDGGDTARPNWTQGATFADVNNDGWLDLYLCRFGAANQLYLNQGDGTFKEEAAARGLALVDASGMAAFCDYDRDGWLDVYVQTSLFDAARHPKGQRDHLYRNRGDGTFAEVTDQAGIAGESMGHSATWWDYDGDGWPDLYVANDYDAPDRLYRNGRDGTFTNVIDAVVPHTAYYAMGSDAGDVNNDGLPDLLVADMAASTREKDLRGMAGSRARAQLVADAGEAAPQLMHNALFLNTGTGRMQEAAFLAGFPATDWTWSVRFEDLDNDGRLDLHVTNGMSREYHNADLLDRIMALENPADSRRFMKSLPPFAERNLAYRNLGDLRFQEVGRAWGLDQTGVSFGAAFADFDGDGDLDLVFANYEAAPTVLRNDSPDGHRVILALRGTKSNRFGVGAVARVETAAGVQVRSLVLARGYLSSSEPVLHFGLGADSTIKRLTIQWPSGRTQAFTDLEADRRYTLTEPEHDGANETGAASPSPQFAEESAARGLALKSEESFQPESQPLVPLRFDRPGPALAVGDLDGDGRDDVVVGGTGKQPARLYAGGARFAARGSLTGSPLDDGPLLVFDADGDGRADILETRAGANRPADSSAFQPSLWLNRADGLAPASDALPELRISVGAAAAADFDRDGRLDVFLGGRNVPGRYPAPPASALLRNAGGRFENVTDALAPGLREVGMVSAALWSDVDGDGWVDLLLALDWGTIRYWHNDAGRGFSDFSDRGGFAQARTGRWTSLASTDFNGDGRPDFVAGNLGLNTPYRAPALLFVGRFGSGGAPQLVEAVDENGRLQPLRSRNELAARIPSITRSFPKQDDYARASLEEILGKERLASAQRFEAMELRSGVFLSQPDGTYRFEPLPRIAQIAPLQGIAAGDFDGDGHADIFAVQNSFAPVPEIGRFDGGLGQMLIGDGRGQFRVAAPRASGLVVSGDAKGLVMLDFDEDGWPDFLVSRNNATALAWRNRGVAGRRGFAVALQGRPGNPTAIGGRVTVELTDGTRQTVEVQAGSSYYSQSAAICFFGFPEANPPRRLAIRWPDGKEETRDMSGALGAKIEISEER